jgi:hypothetical protein
VKDVISIFDDVEYIHLGGDEVMKDTCWGPDPYVKALMTEKGWTTTAEVFTYFLNTIGDKVKKETGKEVVFWGESGAFVKRDPSHILQYWTESTDFKNFFNAYPTNQKIISIDDKFYYDVGFSNRYMSPFSIYNSWT